MSLRYVAGLLAFVVIFVTMLVAAVYKTVPALPPAGPVIKIMSGEGHGSGVHIGGGHVLTAAHVIPIKPVPMTAKGDDGREHKIEVLWVNREYDIALLYVEDDKAIGAARLECREPRRGENIVAVGNPIMLEFVETRGHVAGSARKAGHWKWAVPSDISVAGGMSGGGIFSGSGHLIGITVGMLLQPLGFGGTAVGIAFFVPGSTICNLLARAG